MSQNKSPNTERCRHSSPSAQWSKTLKDIEGKTCQSGVANKITSGSEWCNVCFLLYSSSWRDEQVQL